MGFFGFTTSTKDGKTTVAPRWRDVPDIDEAHREVADVMAAWRAWREWPEAAPFSGGAFDSWPKRLAEGLAFLRAESRVVAEYLRYEEARGHG